jgi:hypothetical protein
MHISSPGITRRLTIALRSSNAKRMTTRRQLVAALAVLAAVLPGAAAEGRTLPRMYRLRLDGYVGPPPEGRREMADLTLRAAQKNVQFQVTGASVTSGKLLPAQVFSRVRPYTPNFILRGPEKLVGVVAAAEAGAHLRMEGAWRPGTRDLLLSSVETQETSDEAKPSDDRPAKTPSP